MTDSEQNDSAKRGPSVIPCPQCGYIGCACTVPKPTILNPGAAQWMRYKEFEEGYRS